MLDRIRECLPAGAYADIQQVFGLDFFICHGVTFAASHQGDLVVRLDEEARDEALSLSGATTWGPNPEVEDEFVIIPYAHISSDDMLRYWVTEAYEYAEHLAASDQIPSYGHDMAYDEPSDVFHESVMDALPPAAKRKKEAKNAAKPKTKAKAVPKKEAARPVAKKSAAKKKAAKPAAKKSAAKKKAVKPAAKKKVVKKVAKKKAPKKAAMKKRPAKKAPGKKKPARKAPARKKPVKKRPVKKK